MSPAVYPPEVISRPAARMATKATLLTLAVALVSACGTLDFDPASEAPTDASVAETDTSADARVDAGPDATPDAQVDAGPARMAVSHPRELRAAWVASVFNLDWPSRQGLTATAAQAELTTLLDALVAAGANAAFLQVRPESDALYDSALEPWSRFLSGTQGASPGWDPLRFAIDQAHARGLELHAWLNPFRAATNASLPLAPTHVATRLAEHAHLYGSTVTMDPGSPAVRDHVVAVVRDIVSRYDVDGVVFDDYFYPYPIAGTPYPDDATYADYQAGGGSLSRSAFRRANVDAFVHAAHLAIRAARPGTRFGVSPFGIYRPGQPTGVVGLDAYEALAADSLAWLAAGDVDYLAPQLYWPTTSTGQPFASLAAWWSSKTAAAGKWLVPALDLTKAGTTNWDLAEYRAQVSAVRGLAGSGARGATLYAARNLLRDTGGVGTLFRTELWARPALPPPLAGATGRVEPPTVRLRGDVAELSHDDARIRGFAVYRVDRPPVLDRWIRARTASVTLERGSWAISAVDAQGLESDGVVLTNP